MGPSLASLSGEAQYRNDEQIDNSLRSVLFQIPGPDAADPAACFSDPLATGCYQGVVDLGALDVERGRDHGMPTYNAMRRAFGLKPEALVHGDHRRALAALPARPRLDRRSPVDDPRLARLRRAL